MREPPRRTAIGGHDPYVRRRRCGGRQVAVVPYLEGIVVRLDVLLVLGLIGRDVGDLRAVGLPGELLHAPPRPRCVGDLPGLAAAHVEHEHLGRPLVPRSRSREERQPITRRRPLRRAETLDRKSTRLNSSHLVISYAVFCLKKKKTSRKRPDYQK